MFFMTLWSLGLGFLKAPFQIVGQTIFIVNNMIKKKKMAHIRTYRGCHKFDVEKNKIG